MTWHHSDPRDGDMTVWDHTGQQVATLAGRVALPDDILQIMEAEVMAEGLSNGLSERQIAILRDAIFQNIEQGQPQ